MLMLSGTAAMDITGYHCTESLKFLCTNTNSVGFISQVSRTCKGVMKGLRPLNRRESSKCINCCCQVTSALLVAFI